MRTLMSRLSFRSGIAQRVLVALAAFGLVLVVALPSGPVGAQEVEIERYPPPDYPVPGGWFYSQESREPESVVYRRGYTVIDDPEASFWTEFRRYGGVPILGYPVSRRYRYPNENGLLHQAFQRGILQWRPERGHAVLANVFEQFTEQGLDGDLETAGIPRPMETTSLPFHEDALRRMSWITEPQMLARYLLNPSDGTPVFAQEAAWQFYGLPQGFPDRPVYLRERATGRAGAPLYLPYVAQRYQKGGLQLFLANVVFDPTIVPGDGREGCVVPTAVGRLARRLGAGRIIPGPAVLPEPVESPPRVRFVPFVPPLTGAPTVDFELVGTGFDPGETVLIELTPPPDSGLPTVTRQVVTGQDGSFDEILTARPEVYTVNLTGETSGKTLDPLIQDPVLDLTTPTSDVLAGTQYPYC